MDTETTSKPQIGEVWEGEGATLTLVAPPNRRRPGYSDMWLCRLTKVGGLTYVPEDRFGTRLQRKVVADA